LDCDSCGAPRTLYYEFEEDWAEYNAQIAKALFELKGELPISPAEKQFIAGAEMMRLAVWHKLSPILEEAGFGGYSISQIFKDVGLLYEVTSSNIENLQEQSTTEFFQKELSKNAPNP
jgi:hypothetical protein